MNCNDVFKFVYGGNQRKNLVFTNVDAKYWEIEGLFSHQKMKTIIWWWGLDHSRYCLVISCISFCLRNSCTIFMQTFLYKKHYKLLNLGNRSDAISPSNILPYNALVVECYCHRSISPPISLPSFSFSNILWASLTEKLKISSTINLFKSCCLLLVFL